MKSNKARCDELSTLLPEALVICGDGSDEELLKEEGIGFGGGLCTADGSG